MIRTALLSLSLVLPALTAPVAVSAQTTPCAEQLVRTVERRSPRLQHGLDIRDLSCHGIVQIFFLLDNDTDELNFVQTDLRRQIEAVFRREGLFN